MLKMKKINYIIVILFGFIILFWCTNKNYFNGTWVRNEDIVSEIIYFGEDGHFSYYTSEGNAVGDYDLCYSYKYSKKDNEIILKCDRDFDELLERIKTIRVSERMTYQKITDLFMATSTDI